MSSNLDTLAATSRHAPDSNPSELGTEHTQLASGGSSSATPESVGPGAVVGRYVVLDEVGRGAMGVVYSAYDPKLDRKVAIKLLLTDERGRRSLGEAQALAKLNHPNVVQVYDVGEHGERVFMAMEFVIGRPLGVWREQTQPSRELILDVFRRAALGLTAAHAAGLVHRDFKPDNVMIADDGRVLVMDFGLAIVGRDPEASTSAGKFWASGTPAYMSPEQFANDPVGPKSDQFSFFVALYEALAGERPFASDSLASLAGAVTAGELRHAAPLRGQPAWLRRLVLDGLALDPAARHESMATVAARIEAGLGRRRRTLGLALAGVFVGGALLSWAAGTRDDPEAIACRADAQALVSAWDDNWSASARGAFEAKLGDDGPRLWRRVEADVGAFAAAWAATHDRACAERFVAGTLDAARFGQRRGCLDDQRAYTTSLLADLDHASADALREIAAVSSELPRPSRCESDEPALEFDSDSQARVADARRELMRARGRADAGDNDEARRIAETAQVSLAEVDAPVTRAELLTLLARVHYEAGDLESGARLQRDALEAASRSGDPRLLASAWLERVDQLSTREKNYAVATTLFEAAEVAVAAAPDDAKLRTELASQRGLLALHAGRASEARDAFALALDTAQTAELGPRALAVHTRRLGAAQARLGEVAAARELFERSAELSAALFGERHRLVVGAYGNLGILCRKEGDDACARTYYEKVIALAEHSPQRAQYLVLLGQIDYDEGNLDEAERLAREAIESYEAAFGELHPDLTPPILLLSNIMQRRGDTAAALALAERLVEVAEASTPEGHPKRSLARSKLGDALRGAGELELALQTHESALRMRRDTLEPEDPRIGYSLVQTADVASLLDDREYAAALAREAIALLDAAPGTGSWRADARFSLARALGSRDTEARALADDALARYDALGSGYADKATRVRTWLAEGAQ